MGVTTAWATADGFRTEQAMHLPSGVDATLAQDVLYVALHRVDAELQQAGHVAVCLSQSDEGRHPPLLRGEPVGCSPASTISGGLLGGRKLDQPFIGAMNLAELLRGHGQRALEA